jgi:hypothetical protein
MSRSSRWERGPIPPPSAIIACFPRVSGAYLGTEVLGIIVKYVYNQSEHW